jgi:hypothetical protein
VLLYLVHCERVVMIAGIDVSLRIRRVMSRERHYGVSVKMFQLAVYQDSICQTNSARLSTVVINLQACAAAGACEFSTNTVNVEVVWP